MYNVHSLFAITEMEYVAVVVSIIVGVVVAVSTLVNGVVVVKYHCCR